VSPILIEQGVPYVLGNNSIFKKGAPEQVYVHEGTLEGFWSVFVGGAHQQRNSIRTPSSKYVTCCAKDFGENERDKDNQHGAELALLGFVKKPIDPTHLMINQWCCEQRRIREILVRGVTSPCWLSL
jgi:hypothetical protein